MDLDSKQEAYEKTRWLVLTVIVIKMIMDGLDSSMLNIALPTISTSLNVATGSVIWIVSAYTITTSTTVLFFGRFGDMIGKTRFYLIGISIYALSTLVSGIASSLEMLVVARVIQAIGASCTMANSQGIITMVFPQQERGRALGIYGGAISLGTLAGPTLGGIIVAYMDWHYIFLLKVPIAIIALYFGLKFFPKDSPEKKQTMDYPGALLYIIAIVPLLYSLQEGFAIGYTSVRFLSGLALAFVSFTAFITIQRKKTMPLLDLSIFKNSIYSVSIFTAFVLSFSNSFRGIIVPFYMQGVLGTPPEIAGLYMSISPIVVICITPISGFLTDRIGGERLAIIGQIINCGGLLLMTTLTKNSHVLTMVLFFCIISFGAAIFQAPNNTLIMSNIPRDKLGIGGSASMSIRNIGSTMGMAFATAVLYGGMSSFLGYSVTGYIRNSGMEDAFMYGMRNSYTIASCICVIGIIASVLRIMTIKKGEQNASE
ncbi:MAG: MFS transporter [Peptococcaceae bacterium]|nr:MFS transporter [Peptococcaceae bacterium]